MVPRHAPVGRIELDERFDDIDDGSTTTTMIDAMMSERSIRSK